MGSTIELCCGQCGRKVIIPDAEVGTVYACPHCRTQNRAAHQIGQAPVGQEGSREKAHIKAGDSTEDVPVPMLILAILGTAAVGLWGLVGIIEGVAMLISSKDVNPRAFLWCGLALVAAAKAIAWVLKQLRNQD